METDLIEDQFEESRNHRVCKDLLPGLAIQIGRHPSVVPNNSLGYLSIQPPIISQSRKGLQRVAGWAIFRLDQLLNTVDKCEHRMGLNRTRLRDYFVEFGKRL